MLFRSLVGVMLPGDAGTMREMAEVFADEFSRLGMPAEQILGLFRNPFYGGAHAALVSLGEAPVRAIIAQAVRRWPTVRIVDSPTPGCAPRCGKER